MKICIAHPNEAAYSETFIRAHVERLPGEKLILTDGHFPSLAGRRLIVPRRWRMACLLRKRLPAALRGLAENAPTRWLARLLKAEWVDVVLAEYGVTGAEIWQSCREAGAKLVVHFHGYDAHSRDAIEPYGERYAAMFGYASAVIAVSSKMGDALLRLGLPEGKLFYNPCGIDVSMFGGANPSAAPPEFLTVGRFVDKKAPHLTLLAFREALQRAPEAALTMAGNGPLLEACRQMARGLEIASSVAFPGVLPGSRIAEMMRAARGFVQHSVTTTYGDSEGTPVAVLEAGASGLPVVSTYHAGIGEAVIHERTGLLVEEGDIRGMGAHMARLALDASYAGQLGAQARRHIAHNYDMEKTIERLNRILAWSAGQLRERPKSWPEWRSPAVFSMQP